MIDVCITAVLRPEILEKTLNSFYAKLFKKHPTRIIINVDPVGDAVSQREVVSLAAKFAVTTVENCPSTASFPKAFKWCWEQTSEYFVFHLEDDWELLQEVDLEQMIGVMKKHTTLSVLRLPMWRTTDTSKNWSVFFHWNGEYFECPMQHNGSIGFCGHPSLLRGSFVRFCASKLNIEKNPEKQIKWRHPEIGILLRHQKFGVFARPFSPAVVRDIGRTWRVEHGWGKKGNKEHFIEWEKDRCE